MNKKVIVVRNSESLLSDGKGSRLWRSGIFTKFLVNNGYDVSWVISSFDHYNKVNRNSIDKTSRLEKKIRMLRTPGYRKNVSIMRFIDHFIFGVKLFFYLLKNKRSVGTIICSYPSPESCFASVFFGKLFKVRVVIDIRDQWPDVFIEGKGKLFYIIFFPYNLIKKYIFKNASGIIAANRNFLNWGLKNANRERRNSDLVIHIPFEVPKNNAEVMNLASDILLPYKSKMKITFAGTVGKMFDFQMVYDFALRAKNENLNLMIIFCGSGDTLEFWKNKFSKLDNVIFTGRLEANLVFEVLRQSDLLIAPYAKLENFKDHLPNKFMEYCAAGRPILSSLVGDAEEILDVNKSGWTFHTSEELYDVVWRCLKDPELVKVGAKMSKSLYNERFHPEGISKQLIGYIEKRVRKVN